MRKKTAEPDQITEALALREAGYTVLSISQRLDISVRSLHRHFAKAGTRKGALKQEVLDAARGELLKRITSDEAIREEAAKFINDDLAHARHIRALVLNASEQLRASTLAEAALVMRASAAYSTVIKNTSDTIRHVLRVDRIVEQGSAELPELVISELSADEIDAMRDSHGPNDDVDEPEDPDDIVVTH